MTPRVRRWAVFLPVAVTLAMASVVGVMIVVQNQEQADQVAAADRAGEVFLSEVGAFGAGVVSAINDSEEADPGKLIKVVDAATADRPQLGTAPRHGIERSATYAEARRVEASYLEPYVQLRRELRKADIALDFIRACQEALALRATDYVGYVSLSSSQPLRDKLIPAVVRARDAVAGTRVPRGQEALAATVMGALQFVIDESEQLARDIDARRGGSFTYNERFSAASKAVEDYATVVKGDMVEALNAVSAAADR